MASINELLGMPTLTGVIQSIRGGVPQTGLDPNFFRLTSRIEGDIGMFHRYGSIRQTARRVAYGGEARGRGLVGLDQIPTRAIHSFENVEHQPTTLMNLMRYDSLQSQDLGRQEIARQTEEFRRYFDNLRVSAVMSTLALQHIYFDGDGNLLPSSSGAVIDIDQQVPAGNKGQLDMLGSGAIIGASWATASTDILGHLASIIAAAQQVSGEMPVDAIYGSNIRKYITNNTGCIALLQANNQASQALLGQSIPGGFGGIQNWIPGDAFGFTDSGGTRRLWLGADQIIFMPKASRTWYEFQEGTYPVPKSVGKVYASAEEAAGDLTIAQGMFQFAVVGFNPPKLTHYAGDTFLPVIKNPNALISADVTP